MSADAGGSLPVPDALEYGQQGEMATLGMNRWTGSSPFPPQQQSRYARSEGEARLPRAELTNSRWTQWRHSIGQENSSTTSLAPECTTNSDTVLSLPISNIQKNPYHHLLGPYRPQAFMTHNLP
jgi:hypothetical protein